MTACFSITSIPCGGPRKGEIEMDIGKMRGERKWEERMEEGEREEEKGAVKDVAMYMSVGMVTP